jgi:hypothetical protein
MPAAKVLGYDFDLNLCYSAVAIASIYLLKKMFFSSSSEGGKSSGITRSRRMSFSSSLLIDGGGFPKDVGVCSPIINIAFYFNLCPTVDEIAKQLEKRVAVREI